MLFINSTKRQGQEIKIFFSSDSNTIPLCEVAKRVQIANLGKISGERYASKYFILLKISLSCSQHSNLHHTATQDDEQNLFPPYIGSNSEVTQRSEVSCPLTLKSRQAFASSEHLFSGWKQERQNRGERPIQITASLLPGSQSLDQIPKR